MDTPRCKALLATTLNGFGVQQTFDALEIKATEENFPLRKHSLLQAILAVTMTIGQLSRYKGGQI
ncbi:MAG: DUF1828 domain-containing protein [Zoogloeaceae bacterium]|nr:DUF1828 domain-containing protein [Zoogloeaceae bacterium]